MGILKYLLQVGTHFFTQIVSKHEIIPICEHKIINLILKSFNNLNQQIGFLKFSIIYIFGKL